MRKAFICPTQYVQGENEILNLGKLLLYNHRFRLHTLFYNFTQKERYVV